MTLHLLALFACAPKEAAAPALSATPEAVDVGTVPVGTEATAEVVLQNLGGGAVEILSASLVEGDARAWSVARLGFDPLEGDVVTTLTITFTPDDEGPSPAEVQVRSDDPMAPSLYIALAGIGGPSTADNDADGYSPADGDCDDGRAEVNPGAEEACDGRDSDCDGTTPADEADGDGDGYRLCAADCDDADPNVHPDADEICDDKDSDCDGSTPDRADADGDGYSICDEDCDDALPAANPGREERCDDGIDNDCSGAADDIDADGDGASACGFLEDCDDADPAAYPVFVDPAVEPGGLGTEEDPFATLADALAGLGTCREVGLFPGTYTEATTWDGELVALRGMSGDPAGVLFTPAEGERAFTLTDGGAIRLADVTLFGGRPAEGDGGAILATGADVYLEGVVLANNTSPADGGAVAVSSGTLWLYGTVFSDNVAGDDGGAVALVSAVLEDDDGLTSWTGNRATQGGALFAVSSYFSLGGGHFEDNSATGDGGALAIEGPSTLYLDGLRLYSNNATGRGGGLALNDVTDARGYLRNAIVADNAADEGGGVAITGEAAELVFANNTLVGNTTSGDGAAVYVDATSAAGLYLWSNVLAWNDGLTGLYVADGNGASVGWNLGYATDSGTDFAIGAAEDAGENLVDDPLFTTFTDDGDSSDDDYSLTASSPGVDSGPAEGTDAGGYTSWADTDGTQNDRGHRGGPGGW